jgi:hypothetical protein
VWIHATWVCYLLLTGDSHFPKPSSHPSPQCIINVLVTFHRSSSVPEFPSSIQAGELLWQDKGWEIFPQGSPRVFGTGAWTIQDVSAIRFSNPNAGLLHSAVVEMSVRRRRNRILPCLVCFPFWHVCNSFWLYEDSCFCLCTYKRDSF